MSREKIIVREPLLDAKQQVIAYELARQHDVDGMASDADLQGLAALASTLNDPDAGWLLGSQKLFLESTPDLLCSEELQALRPENTVLTLSIADLADSDTSAAVQSLRGQGFGFSLRACETLAQATPLLAHVSHIALNGAHANLPAWAALAQFGQAARHPAGGARRHQLAASRCLLPARTRHFRRQGLSGAAAGHARQGHESGAGDHPATDGPGAQARRRARTRRRIEARRGALLQADPLHQFGR